MKTKLWLGAICSLFLSFNAVANCDSCKVNAKLHYTVNWDCSVTLIDSSYAADSCTSYLYSYLTLGDGSSPFQTFSIFDTTHSYDQQSNYTACLIAYARTITIDSTGADTTYCSDTTCVSFYVPLCQNPWRLKHQDERSETSIYPNPAKDRLNIKLKEGVNRIEIVSIDGKQVLDLTNPSPSMQVNTTEYESGVYLFKEYGDGEVKTHKLVIE